MVISSIWFWNLEDIPRYNTLCFSWRQLFSDPFPSEKGTRINISRKLTFMSKPWNTEIFLIRCWQLFLVFGEAPDTSLALSFYCIWFLIGSVLWAPENPKKIYSEHLGLWTHLSPQLRKWSLLKKIEVAFFFFRRTLLRKMMDLKFCVGDLIVQVCRNVRMLPNHYFFQIYISP